MTCCEVDGCCNSSRMTDGCKIKYGCRNDKGCLESSEENRCHLKKSLLVSCVARIVIIEGDFT